MNEGIPVIIAFALGFVAAQGTKLVGALIKNKGKMTAKEVRYWLFRSGGMPSGHAASFIGATTVVGWAAGFTSVEFAICVAMAIIILYDAVNVRYAVGEQGKLLNLIAKLDSWKQTKPQKLVEGHTLPQVIVGSILGFTLGTLTYFVWGILAV